MSTTYVRQGTFRRKPSPVPSENRNTSYPIVQKPAAKSEEHVPPLGNTPLSIQNHYSSPYSFRAFELSRKNTSRYSASPMIQIPALPTGNGIYFDQKKGSDQSTQKDTNLSYEWRNLLTAIIAGIIGSTSFIIFYIFGKDIIKSLSGYVNSLNDGRAGLISLIVVNAEILYNSLSSKKIPPRIIIATASFIVCFGFALYLSLESNPCARNCGQCDDNKQTGIISTATIQVTQSATNKPIASPTPSPKPTETPSPTETSSPTEMQTTVPPSNTPPPNKKPVPTATPVQPTPRPHYPTPTAPAPTIPVPTTPVPATPVPTTPVPTTPVPPTPVPTTPTPGCECTPTPKPPKHSPTPNC